MLEVEENNPFNIRGQGVAWDHFAPGIFYGIIRATEKEETAGVSNRGL